MVIPPVAFAECSSTVPAKDYSRSRGYYAKQIDVIDGLRDYTSLFEGKWPARFEAEDGNGYEWDWGMFGRGNKIFSKVYDIRDDVNSGVITRDTWAKARDMALGKADAHKRWLDVCRRHGDCESPESVRTCC
jgi:hypothetical protein